MAKIKLLNFSGETFFLWGIVFSTLFYTRLALDYTLVPRFLFLSVSLVFTLIWFLVNGRRNINTRFDIILLSYVFYVSVNCSSLLWAQSASEAIFDSSKLVLGFGVFAFVTAFISANPALFEKIGKVALALLLISIVVALSQLSEIGKFDRASIYHITGINSHKNLFSSFLFLMLLFCAASAIYFSNRWRIVFMVAIIIDISILLLLQTRAVWLGLLASFFVFIVLVFFRLYLTSIFKGARVYIALGVVVVLLLFGFLFIFPSVAGKLAAKMPNSHQGSVLEASSGVERLLIWDKTFPMIKKHFVIGVGAGNWQVYFPSSTLSGLWRVEDLNVTFQRPHNDFLWILSETGILGFSAFLVFVAGLIVFSIKALVGIQELKKRMICSLFTSFAVGFMVISFFDFPKERIEHTIWMNIAFAVLYAKIRETNAIHPVFSIKLRRWMVVFPLLLVVFITAIGYLRFKGEVNTKIMYVFRDKHEWENVKKACDNAYSFVYTLDPTSVPLYWYRGNAEASLQNYKEALGNLLLAKENHPYHRNVLNDLGSAYVMNGNEEAATACYREAARISPRFDDPRLNLVSLCISNGNWSEADYWEKSIKHNSERRSYYRKLITENNK